MKVLVTGGAGYIGSHTVIELLAAGHDVTVLDNLSNSSPGAITAICRIAARDVPFVAGDIQDAALLDATFEDGDFDAVMHFAGRKSVAESVVEPLLYYRNNVAGSACLLDRMARHGVTTIVFSSSATVYGEPDRMPITERFPTAPVNPYGHSKRMVEQLLSDLYAAQPGWRISILRYFNPAGAHPSGEIGEDPIGTPNNLLPYVGQVAVGRRECLSVFGNDYETTDGTCKRDYVHVVDLARGHVHALNFLARQPCLAIHNLGAGRSHSVLEVVRAFESATGRALPFRFAARRPGDVPVLTADPARAETDLGWTASYDLDRMCEDHWRWQSQHLHGFRAVASAGSGTAPHR